MEPLRVRILAWASKMGSWPARPLQSVFAARGLTQMLYWTSGISSAPTVAAGRPAKMYTDSSRHSVTRLNKLDKGVSAEEPVLLADSIWQSSYSDLNIQWPWKKATRMGTGKLQANSPKFFANGGLPSHASKEW